MKPKIIMFFCAAFLIFSCSPQDQELIDFSNYTVAKVVCQAESNFLVADGVSQLSLEVKLYARTDRETDDVIEMYREIPRARWRDHDIKFFLEDGTEVTSPYTAASATPSVLQFYAVVDGMRSSEPLIQLRQIAEGNAEAVQQGPVLFEVNVREAIPVTPLKRIPVVFHLVDTEYNKAAGQIIQSDAVYYVIDLWNQIYSRQADRASNGANPNLEFVPALRAPSGKRLEEPGINRVLLTDAQTQELATQRESYVWSNSDKLYWDCDRYLNVWVFFSTLTPSLTESLRKGYPTVYEEGVYDPLALPLPTVIKNDLIHLTAGNLQAWKADPRTVSGANYLEKLGILFAKSNFASRRADFVTPMSVYLGVIPNSAYTETAHRFYGTIKTFLDDQCEDTPIYDIWFWGTPSNGGIEAAGLGTPQIKYMRHAPWAVFRSTNVVEYPSSFQTTITQDQAKRINWVLENAGARQPWGDTSAIGD